MSSTRKTSIIWKLEKSEIQGILDKSNSYSDVLRYLKLDPNTGNHRTLSRRVKEDSLDVSKVSENRKIQRKIRGTCSRKNDELIFVENSKEDRGLVKRRILEGNLIEYKCQCGIRDIWQNVRIVLQLDHKNGINNDNRLENLRFLCPNCHSQTRTFGGRNSKKTHICPICSKEYAGFGSKCVNCHRQTVTKKFEVSGEKLFEMIHVQKLPLTSIGKSFGVSDNAVRKRCKKLNISLTKMNSDV